MTRFLKLELIRNYVCMKNPDTKFFTPAVGSLTEILKNPASYQIQANLLLD